MKKVLIISYSYPPSNAPAAQRPYAFAKYLDKTKYMVTVLTCSNQDSSLGFDKTKDIRLKDVELVRTKSWIGKGAASFREGGMVSKSEKKGFFKHIKKSIFKTLSSLITPDKAIFWLPSAKNWIKNEMSDYDIVITTSPVFSNHFLGRIIKKKNPNIKWVADFRDYHFLENLEYDNRFKNKLNKRWENRVIQESDVVVFISNAMKEAYAKMYSEASYKMEVVYNGFDPEDYRNLEIKNVASLPIKIFYAGSFYSGLRSPEPLFIILDHLMANKLITKESVHVEIAGNIEISLVESLKKYTSFECLRILGRIPHSEVMQKLVGTSLLWLIVGDKITHYSGVPLKFFEYLAARRPILNFAPSHAEVTSIIKNYSLGWNFDPAQETITEQVETFKNIITQVEEGSLQNPLPSEVLEHFSRKEQTKELEEILENE